MADTDLLIANTVPDSQPESPLKDDILNSTGVDQSIFNNQSESPLKDSIKIDPSFNKPTNEINNSGKVLLSSGPTDHQTAVDPVKDQTKEFMSSLAKYINDYQDEANKPLTAQEILRMTPRKDEVLGPGSSPDLPHSVSPQEKKEAYFGSRTYSDSEMQSNSVSQNYGSRLYSRTKKYDSTWYDFGGKAPYGQAPNTKGIDCSGWIANNTLTIMSQSGTYNMKNMSRLLNTHAEGQIVNISRLAGMTHTVDIIRGKVSPGMIIGIKRPAVPDFAKNRRLQISHIVQVVTGPGGELFISESGGKSHDPSGGVKLTPFRAWASDARRLGWTLYGTNPFKIRSKN